MSCNYTFVCVYVYAIIKSFHIYIYYIYIFIYLSNLCLCCLFLPTNPWMFFFVFSRIPILPRRLAKGRFAKGNSECCQFSKEGERVLGEGVVDSGEGDIIYTWRIIP